MVSIVAMVQPQSVISLERGHTQHTRTNFVFLLSHKSYCTGITFFYGQTPERETVLPLVAPFLRPDSRSSSLLFLLLCSLSLNCLMPAR